MSITSYHPKSDSPINSEIRGAQKELIQENDGLFSGPDTDRYIEESRYDGIHFSSSGMILVAKDWTESIDRFLDSKTKSKTLNI